MKPWQWLGLAALAFLVVGLVLGFAPVKADGYDCGSAFRAQDTSSQEVADTFAGGTGESSACDDARSNRQPFAWAAIGVAGVLGVGAWVMAATSATPRRREPESGVL